MAEGFALQELAEALSHARVGVWHWDIATGVVRWSPLVYELVGMADASTDMTYEQYLTRVVPDDLPALRECVGAALESDDGRYETEHRVVGDDGAHIWIWGRGLVLRAPDGTNEAILGTVTDVSARKEAEALTELVTRLSTDYIYVVDVRDGVPLVPSIVAGSFERTTGFEEEHIAERGGWVEVVHPDDRQRVVQESARFAEGKPVVLSYRIVTPDGDDRWIEDRVHPEVHDGRLVRLVGGVSDVTEARQLQAQLTQAQKMEALARLAGSVAHDFNNVLTVLLAGIELDPPGNEGLAADMREACARAAELTQALLNFGRRHASESEIVGLAELVRRARPILERAVGEGVTLHVESDADPRVAVDAGQIQVLLLNLAINARQAMAGRGSLWMRTRVGEGAVLEVVDDGPGVSAEAVAHVFEPYFTTRADEGGTGLGLASCYGIARAHGGSIRYEPAPGGGARFVVELPQVSGEPKPLPSIAPRSRVGGTETLLLVEDDPRVRRTTALMLKRHGYEVVEAVDADEALSRFDEHGEAIALVLSDIRLPGMDGVELATALRGRRAGLPVLLMSGYVPEQTHEAPLRDGTYAFLAKPFSVDAMTRQLRRLLDGDPT